MNYKLIAYAQDFSSFLMENLEQDAAKIKQMILFGSIARGEQDRTSDVDLFVEVTDERIEDKINLLTEKFYGSVKATKYWKLLDIKNKFHCSVGKLEEWDVLQRSLIANGIVLYGKYGGIQQLKHYYLLVIVPGKNRNKNLSTWRTLYGYKQKIGKKVYEKSGLVKEYGGKKLGKGIFIVPVEHFFKIQSLLKKKKFQCQIFPFWSEK